MHQTIVQPVAEGLTPLSQVRPGDRGVIIEVRADHASGHGVDVQELERRLLEFGFVEGAAVEVLHQGLFGQDPIALKVDDMRVALRRRDAADVWVRLDAR
ncbi:FeoA family protein [Phenylobacterium sp. VNQ135]|uniref:FeoA family protein n=1 Tax=Phenylobacterium sp. VNQ135 TaxID=3400922 RepID=UPI003C0EC372